MSIMGILSKADAEDELEDAASRYRSAVQELDLAHRALVEAVQAAHLAGSRPSELATMSGLSRMTIRKHCRTGTPPPVEIPTV